MIRNSHIISALKYSLLLGLAFGAFAQQPAQQPAQQGGQGRGQGYGRGPGGITPDRARAALVHPPLFFKEEWKQTLTGGQHPITPDAVSNPNLELKFYGPAKDMLINGVAGSESDPIRLWTGTCALPCGATLRDKQNYVDLTGLAKIRWVTRVSGLHKLRPMIKLADGTLLVGNHADGELSDYHETEFSISDVKWIKLDPDKIIAKGDFLDAPDLSKIDEVGFVDLMPGSGHGEGGYSVLTRFEVYGKPVPR